MADRSIHDRVAPKLKGRVICDRCGATIDTYADACTADLDDPCPGFLTIEEALGNPTDHLRKGADNG